MTIRKKSTSKSAASEPTKAPARRTLPILEAAAPVLIGLVAFALISGGGILDPRNTGWLVIGDPAQHYLGWLFFRAAPMLQQPMGLNTDFGMDLGGSIVYTDSLPLLAFFFKPFRSFLPADFQYFGIWILACFVLQSVFAWKLLERCTRDFWIKALGSIFFVIAPPFLYRLHAHEALMGHWLILAGLLLYFGKEHAPLRWAGLLLVATLVHAYLLAMAGVLWAADTIARLRSGQLRMGRAAMWFGASTAPCLIAAWQSGYFVLGSAVSGVGFGYFRMNLLALISGYPDLSALFPGTPGMIAKRDYQGMSFLGAGMIALCVMALGEFTRDWRPAVRRLRAHPILLAACALLTLYALSNRIAIGAVEIVTIPLPAFVERLANIFRCSDRMFWPVFYLIYLAAFRVLAARYQPRVLAGVMAGLIVIQGIDTKGTFRLLRGELEHPAWTTPLQSPFWAEAGQRYRKIVFVLPYNAPRGYYELCTFAAKNGMAINIGSFARVDLKTQEEIGKRIAAVIREGRFAADTLYVFGRGDLWEEALRLKGAWDRAGVVNGVRVLAPGWAGCQKCVSAIPLRDADNRVLLPYRLGSKVDFTLDANSVDYALDGWSFPEGWGTWNNGLAAEIGLHVEDAIERDLALDMEFYAFVNEGAPIQKFELLVNGTTVSRLVYLSGGKKTARVIIPRDVATSRGGDLRIRFLLPDAAYPKMEGPPTPDIRRLALGMAQFIIEPVAYVP
ncbi:MAG: DUF6311 domain-containing protein [Bryobacteraceae bacterium]